MLSTAEKELLTACVDGEVTPRQRRQAARLLRRNPEARKLFAELRTDSRELQSLPNVAAPASLAANVFDAVAKLPPRRKLEPSRPRPSTVSLHLWAGYAAAAALLLAVAIGSFLLHSGGPVAPRHGIAKKSLPAPDEQREEKRPAPVPDVPEPTPPVVEMPHVRIVGENDEPETPEEGMPAPPAKPDRPTRPVLAAGQMEPVGQLERVELAMHKLHILHGLDLPEQGKALRAQLGNGGAFRIEIPARDAGRGFERLRAALAGKANIVLDASVLAVAKKPGWRADYGVFLENIAPDDLAEALRLAGNADRAAALKKAGDRCFDGPLLLKELTRWDRRDLLDLLGLDPTRLRPTSKPATVDIRKPLDETTSAQVADALEGRGTPRPGSVVKLPGQGIALVLGGPRGRNSELKRFMETRQPARPGTVQVLLVVRNVG